MSDHLTLGPRVVNSIAWGNADGFGDELSQVNWYENYSLPRVKYSCIQDLETNLGTNNDDDDPVFLDSPACNYRLAANSLSRNAGLNTEVPADDQDLDIDNDVTEKTPDLDMHDRVIETTVGRGAYEVQLAPDCDQDSIPDATEIANCPTNDPSCHDCNGNGVPDGCDIASGFSQDANDNDVPDECDPDCNGNGVPDDLDIAQSTSTDINQSGIPDECESIVIGQWTSEVDFNRGTRINVSWDGDVGGLKRNPIATTTPLPYIWVALTEKGSVVRIRTEDEPAPGTGKTGDILGEYWTTPGNTGSNHSRTTVDLDGNAYVANRYDSWDPQGPSGPMGSVAKFGLVIGGERVDRNGSPDPNGEYLKPPFDYCTCQDRDADGLLRTSRGLGDRLAWTDYFNNDIDGGVETAEDECILAFERTRDVGIRTLGIDPSNNVWIGGYPEGIHEQRDGEDLAHVLVQPLTALCGGGYGGLVAQALEGFDQQQRPIWHEFLWSARGGDGLMRLHAYDANHLNCPGDASCDDCDNTLGDYGLGFDPNTGRIWHSSNVTQSLQLYEIDPWTMTAVNTYDQLFSQTPYPELRPAKGVAVDNQGDVWLAESNDNGGLGAEVLHFQPPNQQPVERIGGFYGTTGVAIDGRGGVWVTEKDGNQVTRYDPDTTDRLVVPLGFSAAPYNYSDMTGLVGLHTSGTGTWSGVYDSQHEGTVWCQVRWNDESECVNEPPEGTSLVVSARAANLEARLPLTEYTVVPTSGATLSGIEGRFIQVRVRLHGTYPHPSVTVQTPSLCDVTVVPMTVCLKGDMNSDGLIDGRDIQLFVIAVLAGTTSGPLLCPGDTDGNGAVGLEDQACFVRLLLDSQAACWTYAACTEAPGGDKGKGSGNTDCNENQVPDINDVFYGTSQDCNKNWVPDECDIVAQTSNDLNENGIPDECELDCNGNGRPDDADIACGGGNTCGGIAGSYDRNSNAIPDDCEPDCNKNGIPDSWDIAQATSADCNQNGRPDECEIDCNGNDIPDDCDVDPSDPDGDTIVWADCNTNGLPDVCDLSWPPPRGSTDCNSNEIPDECDIANCPSNDPSCQDCNANGIPDACDIAAQISLDENEDGIPDECQVENRLGGDGLPGEGLFGGFGPPFEDSEAWRAAWAEYFEWTRQQTWGPNSEYTGSEQFQRMAAKLQELGLPVRAWRR